jgi:hypothetical protein
MFWALQPSPEQRPAEQLAHAAPTLLHWLLALHSCGCVPLQRSEPGRQRHWPSAWHSGVSPEHAVSLCQVPAFVHTRGVLPEQLRVPGTHCPPHVPGLTQT